MTPAPTSDYLDLIDALADAVPWARRAEDIEVAVQHLHTVLVSYPDLAEEALSNAHFAADITDELNSVLNPATEDARIAEHVRAYLQIAARVQVFEDVRDELYSRENEPEELDDMPATLDPWAHPSRAVPL